MISLLALLSVAYVCLQATYLYFWHKSPAAHIAFKPHLRVLVIVAARNEADRIRPCLESLTHQDYPPELMERVVVNDHSSDHTADIITTYRNRGISLLELPDNQQGKKAAITYAITLHPQADVILTTDADCCMPTTWVSDMAGPFHIEPALQMAAGPVVFTPAQSLLEQFQALDFAGMMLLTCAGITGRFQWLANGANLVYRRSAFESVGGFSGVDHLAGGDDVLLMQKIARRQPARIRFIKTSRAVTTPPEPTLTKFIAQRVRWGAKNKYFPNQTSTLLLVGVWLYCSTLLAATVWAFFYAQWRLPVAAAWALKTTADYALLRTATRFFRQPLGSYVHMQPLHVIYITVLGLLSLFTGRFNWHQRRVR